MLNTFDLYDLHAIFTNIRSMPDYTLNRFILTNVIKVFQNKYSCEMNQFRHALREIKDIHPEMYSFCFVMNSYPYVPAFIKDEKVYDFLRVLCELLVNAINSENIKEIEQLADGLHNIPLLLVSYKFDVFKVLKHSDLKFHNEYYQRVLKRLKASSKHDKKS